MGGTPKAGNVWWRLDQVRHALPVERRAALLSALSSARPPRLPRHSILVPFLFAFATLSLCLVTWSAFRCIWALL